MSQELVYQEHTTIDYSEGGNLRAEIRIPFEKMAVKKSLNIQWGTIDILITTPHQGDFNASGA